MWEIISTLITIVTVGLIALCIWVAIASEVAESKEKKAKIAERARKKEETAQQIKREAEFEAERKRREAERKRQEAREAPILGDYNTLKSTYPFGVDYYEEQGKDKCWIVENKSLVQTKDTSIIESERVRREAEERKRREREEAERKKAEERRAEEERIRREREAAERKMRENAKSKTTQLYCSQCGKSIPADSKFCPYCGEKVRVNQETSNIQNGGLSSDEERMQKVRAGATWEEL